MAEQMSMEKSIRVNGESFWRPSVRRTDYGGGGKERWVVFHKMRKKIFYK